MLPMINFQQIKTLYEIGQDLEWDDVQSLIAAAKMKHFRPSEYLIEEGCRRREVFFIRKGLVRGFVINDKGDEITTRLHAENQPVASPQILLFNQAAQGYIQALEPTEALWIDYDVLQEIVVKNPKLGASRQKILLGLIKNLAGRVESFVLYSPEERYIRYVEANPEIVNRVPDKYIANILGITPVSLSRIRRRIAQRKK